MDRYLSEYLISKIKEQFKDSYDSLLGDFSPNPEGPHIFNMWHSNKNGAAFMFWENQFYLSSDLPGEDNCDFTHKYDERYTNFELFLLRLKQILEQGKSTQYSFLLDVP